jgi:hypothetical protein
MWELGVVYANTDRSGSNFSFDEKPQVTQEGSQVLVHSGTIEGREQEVWMYMDNIAAWWVVGPRQQ